MKGLMQREFIEDYDLARKRLRMSWTDEKIWLMLKSSGIAGINWMQEGGTKVDDFKFKFSVWNSSSTKPQEEVCYFLQSIKEELVNNYEEFAALIPCLMQSRSRATGDDLCRCHCLVT